MNKMFTVWSILLIFFTHEFHSFNLDTDNVIVYLDPFKFNNVPLKQSSYFGYSIILYGGSETDAPWIQIGAPRGSINNLTTGVVFRCKIQNVCTLIDNSERIGKGKLFDKSKKDGAWIGGAMDIDEGSNRFVVCGHRWTQISSTRNNDYWMKGACYWSHINESSFQELLPLQEKTINSEIHNDYWMQDACYWSHINESSFQEQVLLEEKTKAVDKNDYYYGQGSAGISVKIESNRLVLGAPGVCDWAGTSIVYQDGFDQLPLTSKQINIKDELSVVIIAHKTFMTDILDLFGYSIASGHFFNKNQLLYIASAPKSLKYYGQILVYKFENVIKDTKRGQQFGEYFGASITVGDINNDGLDDVIVGAPYHASVKYNEGRIYIFLGSPKGSLEVPEYSSVIDGKATNGHFGACVSFALDLDQDGFNDVVVGSPNENEGSGVIYIYKGSQNGLKSTPSQRIVGRDIVKEIRGFGISISKSVDIDKNRYYDIAVSAHLSGHVILFRGRPTVAIHHSLLSYENQLKYNTENFIINACYSFEGFFNDSSINITRTISVDEQFRRAFLEEDENKHIILNQGQILCENSTIKLKKNITNLLQPIIITLSHEFENANTKNGTVYIGQIVNGTDHFCPWCAVYDAYRSSKKHTVEIPFISSCEDNICDTNLTFETTLLNIGDNNTFVIGSEDFIKMQVSVTNEGEKAYLTQVMIELSPAINFRSIPTNCVEQDTFNITCNIDNPLLENKTKTLCLDLDMKGANIGKYGEDVLINVTTLTSSRNWAPNKKSIPLKLIWQADTEITGKSDQQSYSYDDTAFDKIEFSQIYQIEKLGSSPISEVLMKIRFPQYYFYTDSIAVELLQFDQPEGYLSGQPMKCSSDNLFLSYDVREMETRNNKTNAVAASMDIKRNMEEEQADFPLLSNHILYINCSTEEVDCVNIFCSTGPFKKRQNIATLQIKFLFDIAKLRVLFDKKPIIILTTEGKALIKDSNINIERAKLANVSSIFFGNIQKNVIAWWIVTVSVIVGLLLLLLLIIALNKVGFFKRPIKMELEALKNAEIGS